MKTLFTIIASLIIINVAGQVTWVPTTFQGTSFPVNTPKGVHFIEYIKGDSFYTVKLYDTTFNVYNEFELRADDLPGKASIETNDSLVEIKLPYYDLYVNDKLAFQVVFYNKTLSDIWVNKTYVADEDGNIQYLGTIKGLEITGNIGRGLSENKEIFYFRLPKSINQFQVINNITYNCDKDTCNCQETSIQQQQKSAGLGYYPNPTTGLINFKEPIFNKDISINSIEGHYIDYIPAYNGNILDLSRYGKGIYLITIDEISYKVIVQ